MAGFLPKFCSLREPTRPKFCPKVANCCKTRIFGFSGIPENPEFYNSKKTLKGKGLGSKTMSWTRGELATLAKSRFLKNHPEPAPNPCSEKDHEDSPIRNSQKLAKVHGNFEPQKDHKRDCIKNSRKLAKSRGK